VAIPVTSEKSATSIMTSTQRIMANRDAAMAATAVSTTQTEMSEGTLVEREVDNADFVRSSG
jgi:hypothetical protein